MKEKCERFCRSKEDREKYIDDLFLITIKPVLYVCNVDEKSVVSGNKHTTALQEAIKQEKAEILYVSAAIESDIAVTNSFEAGNYF